MVLKRVADAVRDGDTIRAVIRSVRSNEDGKTQGITQPSREAQQELISKTYTEAGLSKAPTRFFEAHGTGTKIGDPREAKAIGLSFREHCSDQDPIYV
jgi:acyl transferase domain-containing protein